MTQVKILNLDIHNVSTLELLEMLRWGGVVFTPNVDHLIKLQKDVDFYRIYQSADYRVCDSQILFYISKLLGTPLRERISGSDLFPIFCNHYKSDESIKIFLLGAAEGVAQKARERINAKVGREIVVAAHSPSFGFESNVEECERIIELINRSEATVLAIGVGAPKQEKWIAEYKHRLKHVKVFLAVGAAIDFEAGRVQRAPKWMSELGMEWLYRLLCEPKRLWKRYIVEDLPFFWLVIQQWLNLYQNPWTSDSVRN
jgi:N-acetylglucosaminyldiphosphoundecaprenol N-acetyl-beta-D-mannosaminyltransferase